MSVNTFQTIARSSQTVIYLEKNTSLKLTESLKLNHLEPYQIKDIVSADNPNQVRISYRVVNYNPTTNYILRILENFLNLFHCHQRIWGFLTILVMI